jgi:hypothetical protein
VSHLDELVERVAQHLPDVPRLAILDAVETEWERLRASAEPCSTPFVLPAVVWRLRAGGDLAL